VKAANFEKNQRYWVCRFDHNHLRITRIIRSLRVLGLEEEAQAYFRTLKQIQAASNISSTSLQFWSRAAQRPLHIAPDVDDRDADHNRGPSFLREYDDMHKEGIRSEKQSHEDGRL
jgi:hypothetical protein